MVIYYYKISILTLLVLNPLVKMFSFLSCYSLAVFNKL